jgi:filamentous hemagglutinin
MMMEHLSPGAGGRHRQTLSYGQAPDLSFLLRSALAREVWDVRAIYRRQGLYTREIRRSLQQVIRQNQSAWFGIFEKVRDTG